jgi:hypothetical protein
MDDGSGTDDSSSVDDPSSSTDDAALDDSINSKRATDDPGADAASTDDSTDDPSADDGSGDPGTDDGSDPSTDGSDGYAGCTPDVLTVGAVVSEADISITPDGTYFDTIELAH